MQNKILPSGPHVECRNVSLKFGRNTILKQVNFSAKPGNIHCIIGPNGGGKSTFIQAILGQTHHSGMIKMSWPDNTRTIGYVPQTVNIDKTLPMTVIDFLALCVQKQPAFFGLRHSVYNDINKALELVDMKNKKKLLFAQLSGGERQRVIFAQSLIPKPQLLILDEPMNSIDSSGAELFTSIIKKLSQDGVTIIWIHHDLTDVKKYADYVTCINQRVLFSGHPNDVMNERDLLKIFTTSQYAQVDK